ncbi:hypothetical protein J3F83DRAFT_712797 [Trichoderma novae-zelandiae]
MGIAVTPPAPRQRQARTRPTGPLTDEDLAQQEANRMHRHLSRIREIRVHLTEEESQIYNRLSRHDGDGLVTLIWSRAGEWAVQRRGEHRMALVEEVVDLTAMLEMLCSAECTVDETSSGGRRRITFRRD